MTTSENTIRIRNSSAEARIGLAGGCLLNYAWRSATKLFDLLRPAPAGEVDPRDAASFPLLPYSNRIKNGRFRFAGQDYRLPLNFGDHPHSIHGIGWQSRWHVLHWSETEAVLGLDHGGDIWPFPFSATQSFTLDGDALKHEIAVTNKANTAMPVGLGMHPYFPRHGGAMLTADVTHVWMTDDTCIPTERVPCPDHWQLSEGVQVERLLSDNQFEPWSRTAHIVWPKDGVAVTLSASDDLTRLVVYAPDGENFFCVEPVSHMTDAFNRTAAGSPADQTGMRVLQPGERWSVWMRLTPEAP